MRRSGRFRRWLRRRPRPVPIPGGGLADPPDEEDALVPRRPRSPRGSGSVALEPPDEPEDVDARGREG